MNRNRDNDIKRRITIPALGAVLFALGSSAGAQQAGKVFRIAILDPSTASGMELWKYGFE